MKKLSLFCLILFAWCEGLRAQIVLKLQLPPVGLTMKSQLWNLSLINTANETLPVQVEFTMTNAATNQKVLSATSRTMQIARGLTQVTAGSATPVLYNVLSPDYSVGQGQEGFLPVGSYTICYTVLAFHGDAIDRLSEECETVEVEPLSPPLQIAPADSSELETRQPLFTWLSPAPQNLFTGLRYHFLLTEVQPMQNSAEAVQQNIPVLSQYNLTSNNLQYTPSFTALDSTKIYAWQITATTGGVPIAKSEVWTFRLKNGQQESVERYSYYARLSEGIEPSFVITNGLLRYAYNNEVNNLEASLKIYDITTSKKEEIKLEKANEELLFGENYKELDLTKAHLKDKHLYLLELSTPYGKRAHLKFQYQKN